MSLFNTRPHPRPFSRGEKGVITRRVVHASLSLEGRDGDVQMVQWTICPASGQPGMVALDFPAKQEAPRERGRGEGE